MGSMLGSPNLGKLPCDMGRGPFGMRIPLQVSRSLLLLFFRPDASWLNF